jgi:hypothetical protein
MPDVESRNDGRPASGNLKNQNNVKTLGGAWTPRGVALKKSAAGVSSWRKICEIADGKVSYGN